MYSFECTTTDAFPRIVDRLNGTTVDSSRAGDMKEHLGVVVQSGDPRERLFFRDGYNLAFQLQEAIAYWTGQNPGHVQRYNSNMKQFMTDGELEGSAYGRYLRRIPHDQIQRVIKQLSQSPGTRRAVINFHQAGVENYDGPDVACTMFMQFTIRDGYLHAFTSMRSQDMHWGYPYDVHNFQWLQEVLAGILEVDVGTYTHYMNSCHYYVEREDDVLDAADELERVRFPDIRLSENDLQRAMYYLKFGLGWARKDHVPEGEIDVLSGISTFYADWLRFMTAYEKYRFHDDPGRADDIASEIDFKPFRDALVVTAE